MSCLCFFRKVESTVEVMVYILPKVGMHASGLSAGVPTHRLLNSKSSRGFNPTSMKRRKTDMLTLNWAGWKADEANRRLSPIRSWAVEHVYSAERGGGGRQCSTLKSWAPLVQQFISNQLSCGLTPPSMRVIDRLVCIVAGRERSIRDSKPGFSRKQC